VCYKTIIIARWVRNEILQTIVSYYNSSYVSSITERFRHFVIDITRVIGVGDFSIDIGNDFLPYIVIISLLTDLIQLWFVMYG